MMITALTLEDFTQGFVAKLVELDVTAIYPNETEDRAALRCVISVLEDEIRSVRPESSPTEEAWYQSLVVLRNKLRPGNSGCFSSFESALRSLRLSFTNHRCEAFRSGVTFSVTKPYASAVVKEYPQRQRHLIECTALIFIGARKHNRDRCAA